MRESVALIRTGRWAVRSGGSYYFKFRVTAVKNVMTVELILKY